MDPINIYLWQNLDLLTQERTISSNFEQILSQIYSTALQFYKANSSDTEAPFWTWDLCITNGIGSSKGDKAG